MICQTRSNVCAVYLLMLENFTSLTFKSRKDQEIVQSDLFELYYWSKDWLLAFNIYQTAKQLYEGFPSKSWTFVITRDCVSVIL